MNAPFRPQPSIVRQVRLADPDERRRIERLIQREIAERMDEVAPPGACY